MNKTWPTNLTEDQLTELHAMLMDKAFSYAEIGKVYGVKGDTVNYYAIKHGVRRTKLRGCEKPSVTLKQVEAELEKAAAQEKDLRRQIESLQQRRQELQIRFETDGTDILVYGIADGGVVLSAPASSWLIFLNANGGGRLREFIQTNFKKGGVR